MEKPLYNRSFTVDYFEKHSNLWNLTSYLKDNTHEIKVELEILVPDMFIKNGNVDFIKYPMDGCLIIKEKIKSSRKFTHKQIQKFFNYFFILTVTI